MKTTKAAAKTTKAAAKTTKAAAKTTKAQTTKAATKTTKAAAKTTKASVCVLYLCELALMTVSSGIKDYLCEVDVDRCSRCTLFLPSDTAKL